MSRQSGKAVPIRLAVEAAEQLFREDRLVGSVIHEPEDEIAASAAVTRLGELFSELPPVIAEALDGARSSGELLSSDRFQGLAEIVQNADDANASEVRLVFEENDLLVGHDGNPVRLRHVLGLATPWYSTKGGEAESVGRFGIGLSALRSLSRTVDVHCHPYHMRLGDPTLSAIEPVKLPKAFERRRWTIFRIPLDEGCVSLEELADWLAGWGEGGLLFLRSVKDVALKAPTGEVIRRLFALRERPGSEQISGTPKGVAIHCHMVEARGRKWMVYAGQVPSPPNVSRVRKATGRTTPVGVALPLFDAESGEVYAGLPVVDTPLPIFVNAQFDPLTSRRDLADTPWNQALVPIVAGVWAYAAIDLFRRDPSAAWCAMPLEPSDEYASSLVGRLNRAILDSARTTVAERVAIDVPQLGWLKLGELAVEAEPLEGVVAAGETAALLGKVATLPSTARDANSRWRTVLNDWRGAGAQLVEPLTVKQALTLLNDGSRPVRASIALAAAGVREELDDQLSELPCVAASDGQRILPPADNAAEAMAKEVSPLGEELGIVRLLHEAHIEETDDAQVLFAWLLRRGAVLERADDVAVVRRLAAAGRSGRCLEEPLTDSQLGALRYALELVNVDQRSKLGHDVGQAITLAAYEYQIGERGVRRKTSVAPKNGYLPRSIDGGKDTFSVAAGKVPGIVWLDGRYGRKLKSTEGRVGVGGRKLLTLLGAETAPRPRPHPGLKKRYQDPRLGLRKWVESGPASRLAEMNRQGATYTLSDWECPAMIAAVEDIALVRSAPERRKRAAALLATLGRAWNRLNDYVEVETVEEYYGWRSKGKTAAFWIWQVREVPWLDDESGKARCAGELRIRTPGTEAIFGKNSPDFLHSDLLGAHPERRNLQAAMSALGMDCDPTRRELVARLGQLREGITSSENVTVAAAIAYRALAESLLDSSTGSDLSENELRSAFEDGEGLILTELGWRSSSEVFAGPPVFGTHRPFAPQAPGADRLWKAVRLRTPSLVDCIEVVRLVAKGNRDLSVPDEAVQLETLRLMANLAPKAEGREVRRKLAKLPLWTTQGWKRERPVFATDDEVLREAIGDTLPIWKPGGELEQFRALLGPLKIEMFGFNDADVLHPDDSIEDNRTTSVFMAAVDHLREDLVRNEPSAERGLRMRWEDLRSFSVWSLPNLKLAVRLPASAGAGPQKCAVHVRMDPASMRVFVRNLDRDLPRADRGGRALAALFNGDRRRVAHAWQAAWDQALDGVKASGLELAQQKAQRNREDIDAAIDEDIEYIQTRAVKSSKSSTGDLGQRSLESQTGRGADVGGQAQEATVLGKERVLVDPMSLAVVDPKGSAVGGVARSGGSPSRRGVRLAEPRASGPKPPRGHSAPRGYTDLERETVGLELARKVLNGDQQEIVDLRAQRGVGADAMDDLKRYYELKVNAGSEPNEIALTDAEWQRARSSKDFFLVVVSGVEQGETKPRVRVIPKPLDQLEQRVSGTVMLSGVREAKGVNFEFGPVAMLSAEENSDSSRKR